MLTIFAGPVMSGKSRELMRCGNRLAQQGYTPIFVKSAVDDDTRGSGFISSRNGEHTPAYTVSHDNLALFMDQITPLLTNAAGFPILFVDELQFFSPEIAARLLHMANHGQTVICSGLDLNSMGTPIGSIMELSGHSGVDVHWLRARCHHCDAPAPYSQRVVHDSAMTVSPDSFDRPQFLPACERHWSPR